MTVADHMLVVFTAQSKVFFYCRDAVCEFVLRNKAVPLNPFRVFEYFLGDRVERDHVRTGNNTLVSIADELWVFGETIADGVLAEIFLAKQLGKPIHFFNIDNRADRIHEISPDQLRFEQKVYATTKLSRAELLAKILGYDPERPPEQLSLFTAEKPK